MMKCIKVGDELNGKWHIVALAVCVSICTKVFTTYAFIIGYVIWLLWLFHAERLKQLHVILSMLFFALTIYLIPTIDSDSSHIHFQEHEQITGKIVRALDRKERVFESVIQETHTNTRMQLTYFPKETQDTILELPYGASCSVSGRIDVVDSARNPGQFDFNDYLQTRGITHQLIISDPSDVSCTGQSLFHHVHLFREVLLASIHEHIDPFIGSWIRALILGDTSAMNDETIQVFQSWGLSHILAISGLHVGLIVGLLYALFVKSGWITKESASYILMGFIPLYIILAGAQPSVLRAGLMVLLFLILKAWFRNISTIDGLSMIFIFLVCVDPYIVYHIGFQFSFLTTIALLLSTKWLSQTTSNVWNIAQISFIAQMAILPLQLNAFHLFQPLSIVLNIIVVSYFSILIIPFLFMYAILFPLLPSIVTFFDGLFIQTHTRVLEFVFFIDQVGFPQIIIGSFPLVASIGYYILFFWMMKLLEKQRLQQSFIAGVLLICTILGVQLFPYISNEGRVTVLDIGQGDAIVIELPYRKGVFMFDAGATYSFRNQAVSDKEYKHIIQPYLYSRGIQTVDALMISHEHLDHNGSAPSLMEEFNVNHFIVSDYYELNTEEESILATNDIELHRLRAFDDFSIMEQNFTVVSPHQDNHDENENSLAVITELGGKNWIFTGDIYKKQEKLIQQNFPDEQIDIWKVAHHGSDTSSAEETIFHYAPEVFLIPVGLNNSHGHPKEEVIETLTKTGGMILRTDENGAIQYRFKNASGTFIPFVHTMLIHPVQLFK